MSLPVPTNPNLLDHCFDGDARGCSARSSQLSLFSLRSQAQKETSQQERFGRAKRSICRLLLDARLVQVTESNLSYLNRHPNMQATLSLGTLASYALLVHL